MANIVPRPGRRERNVKRTAPALRQDPGLDIPACLSQLEEAALQGAPGSARTLTNSQLGVTIGTTEDHKATSLQWAGAARDICGTSSGGM